MTFIIYIICTKKYNNKYTRVYNVWDGPSDVLNGRSNSTNSTLNIGTYNNILYNFNRGQNIVNHYKKSNSCINILTNSSSINSQENCVFIYLSGKSIDDDILDYTSKARYCSGLGQKLWSKKKL